MAMAEFSDGNLQLPVLVGYCHRFVKDCSKIAAPLTKLKSKNVKF